MSNFISRKLFLCATIGASFVSLISSCQDEDFGYSSEQIKYEKAAKDLYGDVPKGKSWDMSSSTNHYHYIPAEKMAKTRATRTGGGKLEENTHYEVKNYWKVPSNTVKWMEDALKEGRDNRFLGSNFVLQLPKNDFVIVPVYQGHSSINSELEIKINGYDITRIWGRSENILVNDRFLSQTEAEALPYPTTENIEEDSNFTKDGKWHKIGYYDGWKGTTATDASDAKDFSNSHGSGDYSYPMYPSFTDKAHCIYSKPIYFNTSTISDAQDFMYLSLHNIEKAWASWEGFNKRWDDANKWTTIGHRLTSINPDKHMLALNVPMTKRPTQLPAFDGKPAPSQVLMIACEDADGPETDHDVNDLVFLIIGYPDAPTVVPTTEVIKKRYMCEDLGGTFDFDFNDIVVDVTQEQTYDIDATPNTIDDPTQSDNITINNMVPRGCPRQTAKIARLCGTIPIQVQIGGYLFPKIYDPTDLFQTRSRLADDGLYRNICAESDHRDKDGHLLHDCDCAQITKAETRGHGDKIGWNPNEEREIPCHTWDPDKNNIIIWADWDYRQNWHEVSDKSVWENRKESHRFVVNPPAWPEGTQDFADFSNGRKVGVTFPTQGSVPFIIAVDQDIPWMEEGVSIPEEWYKENPDFIIPSEGIDKIGNNFYMEKYPAADGEGFIWSGDVTGLAYSTGVTIGKNTPEMAAIKEADSHQYYVIHVYGEAPAGESAHIGLYSAETWLPLEGSDPDGYIMESVTNRIHKTQYLDVSNNMVCATVYLTRTQLSNIYDNGLVVASRTDGLRIKKITMARPCVYVDESGTTTTIPQRDDNNGVLVDPGFTVNILTSNMKVEGNLAGRIIANCSERVQNIIIPEEGKELTASQEAINSAEPERACIPFTSQQFISGTNVELTAVGQVGYKFVGWYVKEDEGSFVSHAENPLSLTYTATKNNLVGKIFSAYATFEPAADPQLHLLDGTNKVKLTLDLKDNVSVSPFLLKASSLNKTELLSTFGVNTELIDVTSSIVGDDHVISINPKAVGETKFIVYQKDGQHSGTSYGVSGEIEVTVKIVEKQLPALSPYSLGKYSIYQWSGTNANAHILSKPNNEELVVKYDQIVQGAGDDLIFGGTKWSHTYRYVDLPHAKWLVAVVNSGNISFCFNRQPGTENYNGEGIIVDSRSKYCTVIDNGPDMKKTYIIDLMAFREAYGYVHLVSVNAIWGTTANVAWIKADSDWSEVRAEWDKLNDSDNAVCRKNANTALAITDLYNWSGYDSNATISDQNTADYAWNLNSTLSNGGTICGHKDWGAFKDIYIDLSSAKVLDATADLSNTTGIQFIFNRTGQDSFVSITSNDRDVCAVINEDPNVHYVVDLVALREKLGTNYLHLNGMHPTDGKANVSSIKVDTKESAAINDWNASQKTDPSASIVGSTTINLDGSATYELLYHSNNSGVWPQLADPNGLVEVLNGEHNNGEISGENIKFVIRGKKAGSGKITITQDANDTYNAASVEVDINVTCPGYGGRVTFGNGNPYKAAQSNETWYFAWLNDVLGLITNTDMSKGVKFSFDLQGYGLTNFSIGSNKGDSGMKKELFSSSSAQNGAVWDSTTRKLTYVMTSQELKDYFQNTSSFFVGGSIDNEHLTVKLYVEAVE